MLEDTRLRIFVTVAELSGFTAAARQLGLSQPAISQNITELEKELGVRLFDRNRGEVVLTADGQRFLGYARQILHWYSVAQEAFKPGSSSLFSERGTVAAPAVLTLDDGRKVEVWTSGSDIHIEGI